MATSLSLINQRLPTRILYNYVPVCHKHRFKTKRPRPQVMERRVFEHVTQAIYPDTIPVLRGSCRDPFQSKNQLEEENPYETFLLKQMTKLVAESQLIVICHKLPHSNVRTNNIRVQLELKRFRLRPLNTGHFRQVIEGTEKENMKNLLHGECMIVTSPDTDIKSLWSILRKVPELIILGAYCDDRLLTRDQIVEISKMPSIDVLLGQLVACLNLAGGARTSSLLGSHQQTLSTNLEQYHKQLKEESS
ncbi:hypothetical protein ACF0H5_023951 [Mactra antiquata]